MLAKLLQYKNSIWAIILLALRTAVAVGLQKFVAIFYGPSGTTLFSHFQNLISIFTQLIQDSIAQALINAFSHKELKFKKVLALSVFLVLILLILSGSILLLSGTISPKVLQFSLRQWLIIGISIIIFSFNLLLAAIYIAKAMLRIYTILFAFQWTIIFSLIFLIEFKIDSFLIFWIVIQAMFSAIYIWPIKNDLGFQFKVGKAEINHFKQFLMMAAAVWISSKWVDYFLRVYAIDQFGVITTGLWQSIVRISEAYRGLFLSFLFLTYYPLISKKWNKELFDLAFWSKRFGYYIAGVFVIILLIYIGRNELIQILYTENYLAAEPLFGFQLIGDLLAMLSFPLAILMMAALKTKIYIMMEFVSAGVFIAGVYFFQQSGIESLVYAHILRYGFYLVGLSIASFKILKK